MLNILFCVVIWLLGFICGVLLGRSNRKKVELALEAIKKKYSEIK